MDKQVIRDIIIEEKRHNLFHFLFIFAFIVTCISYSKYAGGSKRRAIARLRHPLLPPQVFLGSFVIANSLARSLPPSLEREQVGSFAYFVYERERCMAAGCRRNLG